MAAKKRTNAKRTGPRTRRSRGYRCPDCGFVAKHPMGLGRHRSTRHGVISQRQARRQSTGNWLTRQEAARRAGVHYNTIRQWEQAGMLRHARRPRVRGALINATDLDRVLAERSTANSGSTPASDGVALAALEHRFAQLVVGLESLLESLKSGETRPSVRARSSVARTTASRRRR